MVIGYLRVSTGKQHPANQKNEIIRFAKGRGLKVEKWVTEIVSGKTKGSERELGRLLDDMVSGDVMIVTEISRLSRTLTDIMNIMGKCLEKGISLYSTKEGYSFDDTINSKVLCFAFGLVAEIERNLISQRTREALARKKNEGSPLGRPPGERPEAQKLHGKEELIMQYIREGRSKKYICQQLDVSRQTFRRFLRLHPEIPFSWKKRRKQNDKKNDRKKRIAIQSARSARVFLRKRRDKNAICVKCVLI